MCSASKRTLQNALSLSQFVRRQKVLDLYRKFYRLTRQIENSSQRKDVQQWIRNEFQSRKSITDKELIDMHITRAQDALRDMDTMLKHAHAIK